MTENMETMKKLFAATLFCLWTAGCGNPAGRPAERSGDDSLEADASIQLAANEQYLRLQRALGGAGTPPAESYPACYGGSSVGRDGRLTVRIVGDTAEGRARIAALMGDGDFDVLPCRFSYRALAAAMDSLDRFMLEAPKDDSVRRNVISLTMMPCGENHIAVGLLDCSEAQIEAFRRRAMDSPMLVFEQAEPIVDF